jgi:hypothetical protein
VGVCAIAANAAYCRGYNIGIRLIDEFLAKSKVGRCTSFKETAEVVAKQGLQLFLNIQANVTKWNDDGTRCSLVRTTCAQRCRRSAQQRWA